MTEIQADGPLASREVWLFCDIGVLDAGAELVAAVEGALTQRGFRVRLQRPASSRWHANTLEVLDAAIAELESLPLVGRPLVVGVGFGALAALALAVKGLVPAAAVVGFDPLLGRTLDAAWRARFKTFQFDQAHAGDIAFVSSIDTLLDLVEGHISSVPLLLMVEPDSLPHLDPAWISHPYAFSSSRSLMLPPRESTAFATRVSVAAAEVAAWLASVPVVAPTPAIRNDNRGRVFISYKHGAVDGARAQRIERYLNAAGIQAFLDQNDLRHGDVEGVIRNVIRTDCAGAVLVMSDNIHRSRFVKTIELPDLLRRAAIQGRPLVIDNPFRDPATKELDVRRPDQRLRLKGGPLSRLLQGDLADDRNMASFLATWIEKRLPGDGRPIVIDVQSYDLRFATPHGRRADFRIRGTIGATFQDVSQPLPGLDAHLLEPDATVVQPRQGDTPLTLDAYKLALPRLSQAIHDAAPPLVVIQGGAHLPLAIALGGVITKSRYKGVVVISDDHGEWSSATPTGPHIPTRLISGWDPIVGAQGTGRFAVFVNLVQRDNDLFTQFVTSQGTNLDGSLWIQRSPHAGHLIAKEDGAAIAVEIGRLIRARADASGARHVFLCIAGTFPIAVLLGRELNTLHVTLCELMLVNADTAHDGMPNVTLEYRPIFDLSGIDSQLDPQTTELQPGRPPASRPHQPVGEPSLVNLTPHDPLVYIRADGVREELPQAGLARCDETYASQKLFDTNGVLPKTTVTYGAVTGLPDPEPGVVYVVSQIVVDARRDREDLAYPAGLVREGERITGFRYLATEHKNEAGGAHA